jgi:hypothetical protein
VPFLIEKRIAVNKRKSVGDARSAQMTDMEVEGLKMG